MVRKTTPSDGSKAALTYRVRLEREFTEGLRLGFESSGDVLAEDDLTHRLGPILSLEFKGEDAPEIGLGAFVGLNRATADTQIRAEIEFGF